MENSAQSEQVRVERALGGTTCLFCGEERSLKPNCTKQRWKVCNSHFMITCPICGHEAFWMEGMKSGDYYACFSLSCNWTDRVPPNELRDNRTRQTEYHKHQTNQKGIRKIKHGVSKSELN